MERERCLDCGAWLSLGPSNDDDPGVQLEIRAAEIAGDAKEGVGLGGHRPDQNDGNHCRHFYDDDNDTDCCYCRREYSIDNTLYCDAGYLARCIVEHDDAKGGG